MASTPKTAPLPSLADMADELGLIEKEYAIAIAPLKQKLERAKVLEGLLLKLCPARRDEEWNVEGKRFSVNFGLCANERTIDYAKLIKKIGAAVFAKFATCTLAKLEKHVAPEIVDEVVSTGRTGPRKMKTFEKGLAA